MPLVHTGATLFALCFLSPRNLQCSSGLLFYSSPLLMVLYLYGSSLWQFSFFEPFYSPNNYVPNLKQLQTVA